MNSRKGKAVLAVGLLGMRVEGSYKGVVIRNGKEYIQK